MFKAGNKLVPKTFLFLGDNDDVDGNNDEVDFKGDDFHLRF